jgi:HSP20 family protein
MAATSSQSPAVAGQQANAERMPAKQAQGAERTRGRVAYAPRVDIIESADALELFADMPGVTKDSIEITLEQRMLRIYGRADISLPENVGPVYVEYQPGDYERSFTLSEAVDGNSIEARVRNGVLHLKLPKAGAAKTQRIEVQAD